MDLATGFVYALQGYTLVGVLFAVPFVVKGAGRLDPDAARGTWGFRVLIFPGTVALWPWLLLRWMRAGVAS